MTRTHTHRTSLSLASLSLFLGLLGTFGCEMEPELADGELRSLAQADQREHEELAGCSTKRQIVRLTTPGSCSTFGSWSGTKLFGAGAEGALGGFCVYAWTGDGTPSQDVVDVAFWGRSNVADYDADCGVFGAQSQPAPREPLDAALHDTLEDLFRVGLGAIDLGTIDTTMTRSPVTVAVVDTSPMTEPVNPYTPHGEAMVDIIESLACTDGCSVTIQRVLGLPRIAGGAYGEAARGGYVGTFADVAKGIHAAAKLGNTNRRVINLSLGAEPQLFGDESISAGAAAIKTAIEYANCKGALIVAAAGNDAGHATMYEARTEGPLLPALWEQAPAPTAARCQEFNLPAPPSTGSYRPLLHTVGGLRFDDEAMPSTRSDGSPRLVAPASHVNVGRGAPTLTGTSVSAAAVSGTAALLWSYFPDLSAAEIMDAIYAGAYEFDVPADYALVGTNPMKRRVDACRAFNFVLDLEGEMAGHLACAPKGASVTSSLETQLAGQVASLPVDVTLAPAWQSFANQWWDTQNATSQAPVEIDPWTAYTQPQPTQPACPNCTIKTGSKTVSATLDPAYDPASVSYVYIDVFDGVSSTIYKLGDIELSTTAVTEITLGWLPATVRSAKISIEFGGAGAQVNDLIVQ